MNPHDSPDQAGSSGTATRVRLRLLGGATLERDGVAATGRATQRRRVALLALVTLAPGRTLSRDRIVSILWPEYDSDQARHLLAGAVYDLRRSLAEGALVSRGDDIEVGPVVGTDVDEFTAAAEQGELDRALDCYAGPFMDGFHISDAPDFEQWLAGERARLSALHSGVLESAARRSAAAGDAVAAAALWRRLAALEPYNSRVTRELMLALDAAGDRAAALQHARTHTLLLREEFGAEPDGAIDALAERLRAGTAVAAGDGVPRPEPAANPAVHERGSKAAVPAPGNPAGRAAVPTGAPPTAAAEPTDTVTAGATATAEPTAGSPAAAQHLNRNGGSRGAGAAPVPEPVLAAAAARPRRRFRAAAAVVLVAVAAWALYALRPPPSPEQAGPSIAVLPFRNLGLADEHALLGEGLSEEIISSLGRLDGLRVAARTSSFTFRDATDVRMVGRRLAVTHVLEGTVRGGAERLSVTARLIDAATGYEVWTQQFAVPWAMQDIVGMQEEIAQAVVLAMDPELPRRRAAASPLVTGTTADLDAFNEYSTGRHHFHRRTVNGMVTALEHFERAVRRDSTYALAHAAIAENYALLGAYDYGALPPRVAYPAARAAAERALALDPGLAEAHTAMASVHFNFDWDWDAAEAAFRRALAANPGYAPAHHWLSLLLAARGRSPEALAAMLRAAELDPLSPVMQSGLARQYYFARDNVRAIEQYRRVLALDSTFVTARIGLGVALLQAGQAQAAIAEFEQAERLLGATVPVLHGLLGFAHGRAGDRAAARRHLAALEGARARGYFPAEYAALIHIGLGDRESAFAILEQAVENRSGGVAYLGVEPMIDPIRSDPRYRNLRQRLGL
jgi:DNA-binding SARP family transcriptional activator/TolB-like protein/tetratricopeptide (TPR) repeat protein